MPLLPGKDKETISKNIATEMEAMREGSPHVRSRKQAIAIALENARRTGRRRKGTPPQRARG